MLYTQGVSALFSVSRAGAPLFYQYYCLPTQLGALPAADDVSADLSIQDRDAVAVIEERDGVHYMNALILSNAANNYTALNSEFCALVDSVL